MRIKNGDLSDKLFKIGVYIFLIIIFLCTFYPFYQVLIISFNDATDTLKGGLYFVPREISLKSYEVIFSNKDFIGSIKVTVLRTVIGALFSTFFTAMAAYSLSRSNLMGRKALRKFFIFTMYFAGGLIPYYMILKSINLIDSFWVYILPNAINVYNMILIISYMESLPKSLEESAKIDGANDFVVFLKIIFPLSYPILATILLFNAIHQWNSWFDSYVFVSKRTLKTLQAQLVLILNQYQTNDMTSFSAMMSDASNKRSVTPDSIRMAATIVATVPIIMVYPFIQKYFVKGIMIGAVKG